MDVDTVPVEFSAALCRGLIEAGAVGYLLPIPTDGFPRLYAAASLKRRDRARRGPATYSVFRGFMPRPH